MHLTSVFVCVCVLESNQSYNFDFMILYSFVKLLVLMCVYVFFLWCYNEIFQAIRRNYQLYVLKFYRIGLFNLLVIGGRNRSSLDNFCGSFTWSSQFITHWQLLIVFHQPASMREWIIGAFINILGSIAINFGTNLLKLGHDEVLENFHLLLT